MTMRVLAAAIAISVVGHGAAVAWISTRPRAIAQAIVAPAAPPPAKVREPIAVVVIDEAPHTTTSHGTSGGTARIATTFTPRPESPTPTPTPTSTPMPKLDLSGAFVERFLERPPPPTPAPEAPVLLDEQIDQVSSRLHDPTATPEEIHAARSRLIALMHARDEAELQPDGNGYKAQHLAFVGHVDADGIVHLENTTGNPIDALARAHHIDPYAANKLAFLDRTRDERFAIGKREKRRLLARSAQLALDSLHWIWQSTRDLAERKQAVFELWDDCAETGDADLVAGGRDARAQIVEFVAAHLTGPDAYTPEELAALNAHKASVATFAPYTP